METIKLKTHIVSDGVLKLELPTKLTNRELEVLVVIQPLDEEVDEWDGRLASLNAPTGH